MLMSYPKYPYNEPLRSQFISFDKGGKRQRDDFLSFIYHLFSPLAAIVRIKIYVL